MKAPIPDISRDLFDLTEYCSIVTGASLGIGLKIAEALAYIPLGRIQVAEDLAGTVIFLASKDFAPWMAVGVT